MFLGPKKVVTKTQNQLVKLVTLVNEDPTESGKVRKYIQFNSAASRFIQDTLEAKNRIGKIELNTIDTELDPNQKGKKLNPLHQYRNVLMIHNSTKPKSIFVIFLKAEDIVKEEVGDEIVRFNFSTGTINRASLVENISNMFSIESKFSIEEFEVPKVERDPNTIMSLETKYMQLGTVFIMTLIEDKEESKEKVNNETKDERKLENVGEVDEADASFLDVEDELPF